MPKARIKAPGVSFERYFTKSLKLGQDVAELFTWTRRHVKVTDGPTVVYEADVEAPDFWSDLAVTVAAKTWFRRVNGKMEDSIKSMLRREADALYEASKYPDIGSDYFGGDDERRAAFRDEVFYIQAAQYAAFNTPVHVNLGVATAKHVEVPHKRNGSGTWGVYTKQPPNKGPQASACFIQAVEDTMESLCALQTSETQLFRRGSGTGSNLSALRPAGSPLGGGGTASGPVSFMRAMDCWAGTTKSGGSSRRAALMRVLDVYHPDVVDFIQAKRTSQKMIRDLVTVGWSADFNAEATKYAPWQNANNSVRVDDAFMTAATTGGKVIAHWPTQWGDAIEKAKIIGADVDASKLLDDIAAAAHDCGDPGMQYDTTINKWHTVPQSGRIDASNPCSEYMHLQDSACNLASLRLTKFLVGDGSKPFDGFDVDAFTHVARTMFIAQEILVGASSYPTAAIAKNSHDFRPLGLGYCDLGALLMQLGLPYDSDAGRSACAAVTSLLGGAAYRTSAELARDCGGPFAGFAVNRESMLGVIDMHCDAAVEVSTEGSFDDVAAAGVKAWNMAHDLGMEHGFRNAQATVLAPTGTIGFALDCDTTGIEPDTALVKRKKLAGGGVLEYVNGSVAPALRRLGYDADSVENITSTIKKTGAIPLSRSSGGQRDFDLAPHHRPVFATAFGQPDNEVSVGGHLKMMAMAQPFLSGAISKTVNVPSHYTVAQIRDVFVEAWRLGLKAVAVYRDGSKDQPLEAKTVEKTAETTQSTAAPAPTPAFPVVGKHGHVIASRRRLAVDTPSLRHKFSIGGVDGYVHLGFYDDARTTIGEIFVRMEPKAGDAQTACDLATQAASVAIQHGASVESFLDRWEGTRFAPSGFTGEGDDGVAWASSPLDYLAKWLRGFLARERLIRDVTAPAVAAARASDRSQAAEAATPRPQPPHVQQTPQSASQAHSSHFPCPRCGSPMRQDGACRSCPACGHGQGGCGA